MTGVWSVTATCVASGLLVAVFVVPQAGVEILLGMVAPVGAGSVTLALVERTYRRDPARLTRLMIKAFAAKLVLFGVYVALVLGVAALRATPFVVSFTVFFVVLHLTEAVHLRRVFAEGAHATRS